MSQSDSSFTQRKQTDKPTHLLQMDEPWRRLHDAATVASSLRSARPSERQPQVPGDSLDFQLTSVYDHHSDFFWNKNQILYQKETVTGKHRKQEKLADREEEEEEEEERDIRVWVDPQRRSIYSIK